ncbi:tryptophan aminotransferase-related protein 3-like protein [Tanacetum coccineum]
MLAELRKMFEKPPAVEIYDLVDTLHSCKQAPGKSSLNKDFGDMCHPTPQRYLIQKVRKQVNTARKPSRKKGRVRLIRTSKIVPSQPKPKPKKRKENPEYSISLSPLPHDWALEEKLPPLSSNRVAEANRRSLDIVLQVSVEVFARCRCGGASIVINLYDKKPDHESSVGLSWSAKAAAEAEYVASISCSGHGRAYLDGSTYEGEPVCECYDCYVGANCAELSPGCAADANSCRFGFSKDTQLRVLKLLKVAVEGDGKPIFEFAYNKMRDRWERLTSVFAKSTRFSIQQRHPLHCNFFNETRLPSPGVLTTLMCHHPSPPDLQSRSCSAGNNILAGLQFQSGPTNFSGPTTSIRDEWPPPRKMTLQRTRFEYGYGGSSLLARTKVLQTLSAYAPLG